MKRKQEVTLVELSNIFFIIFWLLINIFFQSIWSYLFFIHSVFYGKSHQGCVYHEQNCQKSVQQIQWSLNFSASEVSNKFNIPEKYEPNPTLDNNINFRTRVFFYQQLLKHRLDLLNNKGMSIPLKTLLRLVLVLKGWWFSAWGTYDVGTDDLKNFELQENKLRTLKIHVNKIGPPLSYVDWNMVSDRFQQKNLVEKGLFYSLLCSIRALGLRPFVLSPSVLNFSRLVEHSTHWQDYSCIIRFDPSNT